MTECESDGIPTLITIVLITFSSVTALFVIISGIVETFKKNQAIKPNSVATQQLNSLAQVNNISSPGPLNVQSASDTPGTVSRASIGLCVASSINACGRDDNNAPTIALVEVDLPPQDQLGVRNNLNTIYMTKNM